MEEYSPVFAYVQAFVRTVVRTNTKTATRRSYMDIKAKAGRSLWHHAGSPILCALKNAVYLGYQGLGEGEWTWIGRY